MNTPSLPCRAFVAIALVSTPAIAQNAAVTFPANPAGYTTFSMPSGNIECIYTPAGGSKVYQPVDGGPELSCDRAQPQYLRITMTPRRVERIDHVGDAGCCGADNPLPYGSRWSMGPYVCDSAETGLVCKRGDGKGFSISRAKVDLF